jgi:hypothetical protein
MKINGKGKVRKENKENRLLLFKDEAKTNCRVNEVGFVLCHGSVLLFF